MKISKQPFGTYQNQQIQEFELANSNGMVVKLCTYGATITSISVPDQGKDCNLVCGFDTLDGYFSEAYKNNAPYFGCTVGRYASRIKDGKFILEGKEYQLAVNNGSNHLHGGLVGWDKKVWEGHTFQSDDEVGVIMKINSPHLEEGYPGNVDVMVKFCLNNTNELLISYEAETDQTTPLSLTNHSYFNLSGFKHTIENHKVKVMAKSHLVPDETNVPLGEIEGLAGSAADLSWGKLFKEAFEGLETGFEHYFLFDKALGTLAKVAEFEDIDSGRKLEVETTEPGMLFYSGYFTSDELKRESGDQYGRYRGFCCETHRYPNGPNIADSPGSITLSNEKYTSKTIYRFSW